MNKLCISILQDEERQITNALKRGGNGDSEPDALAAIHYAAQLPFRAGATRTIILLTCDECSESSNVIFWHLLILKKNRGILLTVYAKFRSMLRVSQLFCRSKASYYITCCKRISLSDDLPRKYVSLWLCTVYIQMFSPYHVGHLRIIFMQN